MEAAHGSSQPIVRDALLSDLGVRASRNEFQVRANKPRSSSLGSILLICLQSRRSKKYFAYPLPTGCSSGRQKKSASICSVAIRCFNCSNLVKPRKENISLVILI